MTVGVRVGITSGGVIGASIGIPNSKRAVALNRMAIISGQSNGFGKCVAANVTLLPNPTVPYPNVLMYDHNSLASDPPVWVDESWRALAPRTTVDGAGYPAGTCGVELSMGRLLDTSNTGKWSIAKMTIDGSLLETYWVNPAFPTVGSPKLQQQLLNFIAARLNERSASLGAFIWIQGEGDAGTSPANTDYYANLGTLFNSITAQFGNSFPFIIHRLSNRNQGRNSATIRSAEESYAAVNPRCYITVADDIALRDAAHYVDDGYVTVGQRIATAITNYYVPPVVANPVWTAAGVPVIMAANQLLPTWPIGHKAGDVALLALSGIGQNAYTLATAAGFVAVPNGAQHDAASGLNSRLHVWWCRAVQATMDANGGVMPNPVVTEPAGADQALAVICTFRGCTASGNPWDVTAGATGPTAAAPSVAVSVPGTTTTVANTLVVAICSSKIVANIAEVDLWANPDLTNLTEQFDVSNNTGAGSSLGIATGVKAAFGAYQATTATLATSASQTYCSIALKP